MSAVILAYQCFFRFPSLSPVGDCDTGSVDFLLSKSFKRLCRWMQRAEGILDGVSWGFLPPTAADHARLDTAFPVFKELLEALDEYTDAVGRGGSIVETLAEKILSLVNTLPKIIFEAEDEVMEDCDDDSSKDQEAEVRHCDHKVAQLGGDALIAATKAGHIGIVDMLSKAGISMDERDELGQTALFHAVRRHDKPLIDLLIDRGVDKGVSDHQDKTAWVLAIEEGDWELIIRLLDEAACSGFPQAWNQTPIQWARKRGHEAAAAILEELQERLLRREMIEGRNGLRYHDHELLGYDDEPANLEKDDVEGPQESIIRGNDWYALVKPQPQSSFDIELVDTSKPGFPLRVAALRRSPESASFSHFLARELEARRSPETRKGSQSEVDDSIGCACVSLDEQTVATAYGSVIKINV
ncbi:hypothetical protein A9Z42_0060800 [Trichoderma parareesei]|uniref:Uncharacterized protein n=1 Tax=Trichoderma parareesei TaxID=858221 RepID=A0A2H2ZE72_TRIPA|nr:hypothetical protein A9Z42_0060800 [Trichoderma parareesei]